MNIRDEIAGAMARGYCSLRNSHKDLDASLIEDMLMEVMRVIDEDKGKEESELHELLYNISPADRDIDKLKQHIIDLAIKKVDECGKPDEPGHGFVWGATKEYVKEKLRGM